MATAEHVYNGIPDELRESVLLLYKDFGTMFLARETEEREEGEPDLNKLSELGILHQTPGSSSNAPSEYRFVPEALRDIEGSLRISPSKNYEWGERSYTFDPKKVSTQIRLFMPYMEEFIESFSGRTFTHRDFSQFTEGIDI